MVEQSAGDTSSPQENGIARKTCNSVDTYYPYTRIFQSSTEQFCRSGDCWPTSLSPFAHCQAWYSTRSDWLNEYPTQFGAAAIGGASDNIDELLG